MQGKVSRMTSPMRKIGDGFATRATKALFEGGKEDKERYSTNYLRRGIGQNLKGGLKKKN